jgi:hypothetical protein
VENFVVSGDGEGFVGGGFKEVNFRGLGLFPDVAEKRVIQP